MTYDITKVALEGWMKLLGSEVEKPGWGGAHKHSGVIHKLGRRKGEA